MNRVRVSPGATQLTVIPSAPSGLASERAIPTSELPVAVEDRDLVPGRGERADDRSSDPAGAARDNRPSLRIHLVSSCQLGICTAD